MRLMDISFQSFDEWRAFADSNPGVIKGESIDDLGNYVFRKGFLEPLTRKYFHPGSFDGEHRNWREALKGDGVSSRVRAVMRVIEEKTADIFIPHVSIYAPEATTPFAMKLRSIFPRFVGSEFASNERMRDEMYPIQNEDLLSLTLRSERFDIVSTNEVLEHVPNIDKALGEIHRVLKPGGWHIGTVPFFWNSEEGVLRAQFVDGKILHLMEPEIHGNPVDPEGGSLVFEIPGWSLLKRARSAGFREAHMRFMLSELFGYFSEMSGVFVFCAQK